MVGKRRVEAALQPVPLRVLGAAAAAERGLGPSCGTAAEAAAAAATEAAAAAAAGRPRRHGGALGADCGAGRGQQGGAGGCGVISAA